MCAGVGRHSKAPNERQVVGLVDQRGQGVAHLLCEVRDCASAIRKVVQNVGDLGHQIAVGHRGALAHQTELLH